MRKPLPNIFPVSTATMRWSTRAITLAPKKLIRTRRASEGSASEPSLARFDVAIWAGSWKLVLAKMARLFTWARSFEYHQPGREPHHGHGRRFASGSQEVDRRAWTEGQRQAFGHPHGRHVPAARGEDVLLAGGWGGALRDATPGPDQPFPARPRWRKLDINSILRQKLLEQEASDGLFLFLVDATLNSQAGKKTENTYSTGNRKRRPRKGRRYGKKKHAQKNCHSFTMGLLITPSGIRIPFCKPYYTHEYCKKTGRAHRTTAEAAADLIRELPLPEEAQVIVLGDTAYDSEAVQKACQDRSYSWIVPCNPERVLAGPKGKRPKVRSLLKDWSQWSRQTIRLAPGQGSYAVYRRLSPHRIGPKAKPRAYYAHQERRRVHSVGEVRLVFSTTQKDLPTATPDDVKILMTNDLRLSVRT